MRVHARWLLLCLIIPAALFALSGCAFRAVLSGAEVGPAIISPNADGSDDVALIQYRVGQTADVSIYFVDAQGARHYFRNSQRRSPGEYKVYWGGVINDPQVRDVPGGKMLVQSQVLPDGEYTWVIEAEPSNGDPAKAEGRITLQNSDTALPELRNFTVVPQEFTPNQDSIRDRVSISYYLTKDAERVQVYLEPAQAPAAGQPRLRYPIAEDPTKSTAETGQAGYHGYDYDGGVDKNAQPPPDGDYVIYAQAEDRMGNRVVVSSTLTIREGGKPRANIVGGEIDWQGEVARVVGAPLGGTLCFTATIENIGPVPIRTAGPWPGTSYAFTQNYNTLAMEEDDETFFQQAGSWRFGINFDTTGVDYPFRWAIGSPKELEERIIDGKPQYYLLPGKRSQVRGCVEFDEAPPSNTQFWWAGLIHEFVAVENNYVDRISVQVGSP
jgi:hypothetical protein